MGRVQRFSVLNPLSIARNPKRERIQHVPEAANFPQSHALMAKVKNLLISVRAASEINLNLQVESDSQVDAILLSQLLQAGMLLRRYRTKAESNPELAKLLDAIGISTNGRILQVFMDLTSDQMISLI